MATTGPRVTLTFAGDPGPLRKSVSQVESSLGRVGVALGALSAGAVGGGVAAAGAIAGVGLAFAGIGIAAAAQSQQVKTAFSSLKDSVVKDVQEMAKPFEPVLVGIAAEFKSTFAALKPAISEAITGSIPIVQSLVRGVQDFALNVMPGFTASISAAKPVVDALSAGLASLGTGISGFLSEIAAGAPGAASILKSVFDIISPLLPVLGKLISTLSTQLAPVVAMVADAFTSFLIPALNFLVPVLGQVLNFLVETIPVWGPVAALAIGISKAIQLWTVAQTALNVVLALNPIGIVVVAITALVAALVYAYKNSETFRNIVNGVWESVKSGVTTAVNAIIGVLDWFGSLPSRATAWFGGLKDSAVSQFNSLVSFVTGVPGRILSALGDLGSLLYNSGRSLITGLWNGIKSVVGWIVDNVKGVLSSIRNLFPFSPAKEGPFAGAGYVDESGKALGMDFAKAITGTTGDVMSATEKLMQAGRGALSPTVPGRVAVPAAAAPAAPTLAAPAQRGQAAVRFEGNTNDALATVIMNLIRTGRIQIRT